MVMKPGYLRIGTPKDWKHFRTRSPTKHRHHNELNISYRILSVKPNTTEKIPTPCTHKKGKVIPLHAMEAFGGRGGKLLLILKSDTRLG
jgi:hypothetical protein